MAQDFGGFGLPQTGRVARSTSNDFGGFPSPKRPRKRSKSKQLTARQLAMMMYALQHPPKHSFGAELKGIGKGALGGATWALDKLMRPSWAVTAGTEQALKQGSFFSPETAHAALQGLEGKRRIGFGQILEEQGVLKGHRRLRGAAGFGLDVVTDPTMYLTLAADVPTMGAATPAYLAAKTGAKALTTLELKAAARTAGKLALEGTVDEGDVALLRRAGPQFNQRAALAEHVLKGPEGRNVHPWAREKNILEEAASAEASMEPGKKLTLRYGLPKAGVKIPTPIPLMTRPGKKLAEKEIPIISQLVDKTGKLFVPGFDNKTMNAMSLARKHAANHNGVYLRDMVKQIMQDSAKHLSEDEQLYALHFFEQPLKKTRKGAGRWAAVVPSKTHEGLYSLNPQYVQLLRKQGRLTDEQLNFVDKYHQATEFLIQTDRDAGVQVEHLGASGRLYVPHVLEKGTDNEVATVRQHGLLTDAGFQGKRKGAKLSVRQIKDKVATGEFPRAIETDPLRLLWRRARAGSERQADMALINSLKASVGVSTRVVNPKRVARAEARLAAAEAERDAAHRAAAAAEADMEAAADRVKGNLTDIHNKAMSDIQKKIRDARIQGRAKQVKSLTDRLGEIADEIKRLRKPGQQFVEEAAPKAAKAAPKAAAPAAEKGFTATETRMFRAIQGMRKELDLMDKGGHEAGTLPKSMAKWGRYIKGNRKMSRRDRARQFLDRREEKILRRAQARRAKAPVTEAPKPKRVAKPKVTRKPINKAARIRELQAEVDQIEKALGVLKNRRIMTPAIVKHEAEKVNLRTKLDESLAALDDPMHPSYKKLMGEEMGRLDTAIKARQDALAAVSKAKKSLKAARKGAKNKAAHIDLVEPKGTVVLDEYGNKMRFPKDAADEMLRLQRLVSGEPEEVENFAKGIGKWMGAWKVLVTTVNPGYRIRNTMTDFWNMWVKGVPGWAMGKYGIEAAHTMSRASRAVEHAAQGKLTQAEQEAFYTVMEAANHGITAGLFAGDVQAIARTLKHTDSDIAHLAKNGHLVAAYAKMMQDFNRNAENWGRLTHYLYRTKSLGESVSEAARNVKLAHFDYEDLTPFEQKIMKKVFPFYTWSRKNIPYQVKMMLQNPGRYSAFPKLAQEATYASGSNPNDIVPGYVEQGFGFPIGKGKFYMPQFGVSDLQVFQGPGAAANRLKGMIGPQYKIPGEIISGKSFFTGQDIAPQGHTRVPISARGASLLGLLPGANAGMTGRPGPDGNQQYTHGINPWYSYFAGQIPGARAALGIGAGTKQKRNSQLISYFGGQSVQQADPHQQAYYESLHIQDEVDKFIADLREQGRYPRSKRKKSSFDNTLLQLIQGGG